MKLILKTFIGSLLFSPLACNATPIINHQNYDISKQLSSQIYQGGFQDQDIFFDKEVCYVEPHPFSSQDSNGHFFLQESESLIDCGVSAFTSAVNCVKETARWNFLYYFKNSETLFKEALEKEDIDEIKFFIEHGIDINLLTKNGYTPLTLAIAEKKNEIAKLLIEHGADVNQKAWMGGTLLSEAISSDNLEIVKLLIEHGADVNNIDGQPLLFKALSQALSRALYKDLHSDNLEIIRLLIENGADVNCKSQEWSILYYATFQGAVQIVKLLIENGADVNFLSVRDETPLIRAVYNLDVEIAKLLIKHGAVIEFSTEYLERTLLGVTNTGNVEMIKFLIGMGADLDYEIEIEDSTYESLYNDNFITKSYVEMPLFNAISSGNIEIVKLLIDHGANVNYVTKTNETPLSRAVSEGNVEIVKLLLELGIDVNHETKPNKSSPSEILPFLKSTTPLFKAIISQDVKMEKLLIDHGADVNYVLSGGTILHQLSYFANTKLIEHLFKNYSEKIDISARDVLGRTPLEVASTKKMQKYLIEKGAKIEKKDDLLEKPKALILHAMYDPDGSYLEKNNIQFLQTVLEDYSKVPSLRIYDEIEFLETLQDQKEGSIELLIISAHGRKSTIALSQEARYAEVMGTQGLNDKLKQALKALSPNATILLESCSTGEGDDNFAQYLIGHAPKGVKLFAPKETMSGITFGLTSKQPLKVSFFNTRKMEITKLFTN